jgi:DMSO/TMAO reductase YedYZ molybdopterin-dependent catalytic subunit
MSRPSRPARLTPAAPAAPPPRPTRRRVLAGVAALAAGATLAPAGAARASAALLSDTEAPDTVALFAELDKEQRITPILTATKDFYHVSKNISDPTVDHTKWKLTITGMVNEEKTYTYDELVRRATTKNITTLSCISNPIDGDLISTAQWTGIPLMDLLKEAGVKPGAVDIMYHCADDYEDSIPVAKGMGDPNVLLVVGMDGAPLPDYHGAPARLIVPNLYGMKNAKWLERLELVGKPFLGYWETQGWSYAAIAQIWGRIDYPGDGDKIKAGPTVAAGVATAGDRGIKRVEVSLNGGDTWVDATLEPSLNPPFTWVRWAFPFDAKPGKYNLVIRATDGTGKVMEKLDRDPLPDGATGWPSIGFQAKA